MNTATSLVVAGLLVLLGYAISRPLVALSRLPTRGGMPLAMGLILVSLFVLVSRKKAITQVIGFLMLENGLALLAVLGTYGIPLIVELGVFLDALLGIPGHADLRLPDPRDVREHRRRAAEPAEALTRREHLRTPAGPAVARGSCWRWSSCRTGAAVGWVNAVLSLVSLGARRRAGRPGPGGRGVVGGLAGSLAGRRTVGAAGRLRRAGDGAGRVARPRARARTTSPGAPGASRSSSTCSPSRCSVAVTTNNVGLMWVAIEATTITSAMLIAARRHEGVRRGLLEVRAARVGGHRAGLRAAPCSAYFDFVSLAGRRRRS